MYYAIPVYTLCIEYGTNIYFRSAQVLDWQATVDVCVSHTFNQQC